MKRYGAFVGVVIVGLVSLLLLRTSILAQGPGSQPASDSNPADVPEVVIPQRYQPGLAAAATAAQAGGTTVYFTPQDENTSVTVMFLYNTSTVTGTVSLQTYRLNGTVFIDTSVAVPPGELVRISADPVSTVSGTWQDAVLVNFTTFSTYARMTLPAGVKATGHVVWNDGSTYDPLQVAPALPLRFSTDPATVFLPTIQNGQ